MKKSLAIAAVMCVFTAGAFAQASAPMMSGSAPMASGSAPMKSHMKKSTMKHHKKTDKGAMPASAASGAM